MIYYVVAEEVRMAIMIIITVSLPAGITPNSVFYKRLFVRNMISKYSSSFSDCNSYYNAPDILQLFKLAVFAPTRKNLLFSSCTFFLSLSATAMQKNGQNTKLVTNCNYFSTVVQANAKRSAISF